MSVEKVSSINRYDVYDMSITIYVQSLLSVFTSFAKNVISMEVPVIWWNFSVIDLHFVFFVSFLRASLMNFNSIRSFCDLKVKEEVSFWNVNVLANTVERETRLIWLKWYLIQRNFVLFFFRNLVMNLLRSLCNLRIKEKRDFRNLKVMFTAQLPENARLIRWKCSSLTKNSVLFFFFLKTSIMNLNLRSFHNLRSKEKETFWNVNLLATQLFENTRFI